MRRTRCKTHKRHAKRHTRRRGGNGNESSAKKNNNGNPLKPINLNAPFNYETRVARGNALARAIGPLPPHNAVPVNRFGQPKASAFKAKNKGFKPALFALPGSAAALAVSGPVGAPLARQPANNKVVPFALPGSAAALAVNGLAGAPLARQPANNRTKITTKVAPLPNSPFSPTSGY